MIVSATLSARAFYQRSTRPRRFGGCTGGAVAFVAILLLIGCEKKSAYVPQPPPEVGVALPLQRTLTLHVEQTGTTVAVAAVDLVARVEGFLTDIKYQDGAFVKKDQLLFVIQQSQYQDQLKQAEAAVLAAKAQLLKSQNEFDRQSTLLQQGVTTQVAFDMAHAQRDTDSSAVMNAEAMASLAKLN